MKIAMIGLGKMGANMTTRLLGKGHQVVAFDVKEEAVRAAGARKHRSPHPGRSGGETGRRRARRLGDGSLRETDGRHRCGPGRPPVPGDIVIDGGNSNYKDTMRRAAALKEKGRHFVDVGTSGGIWGLPRGTA